MFEMMFGIGVGFLLGVLASLALVNKAMGWITGHMDCPSDDEGKVDP